MVGPAPESPLGSGDSRPWVWLLLLVLPSALGLAHFRCVSSLKKISFRSDLLTSTKHDASLPSPFPLPCKASV